LRHNDGEERGKKKEKDVNLSLALIPYRNPGILGL
jgi:hypothetical protein